MYILNFRKCIINTLSSDYHLERAATLAGDNYHILKAKVQYIPFV